jgi:hypothetical protein
MKVGTKVVAIRDGENYKEGRPMSFSSKWNDYKKGDIGRLLHIFPFTEVYEIKFDYVRKEVCPMRDFKVYIGNSSYDINVVGG